MLDSAEFVKLSGINTQTATSDEDFIENVKKTLGRKNNKWLHRQEEFQKIKGHHNLIALIGGGPSVEKELDKIKDFKLAGYVVVACGSSHDWCIKNNVIPDYCVLCDPDPITANYITLADNRIKYLVASSCDEKVFEILKNKEVILWHCESDALKKIIPENDYFSISGGCTVGLRAVSIAIMLGYTNIHFWGFDSCLGIDDKHHAYDFSTDKEELGVVYNIRIGFDKAQDDKTFRCAGYQLAQASHFEMFYKNYHEYFTPTFHGEGLLTSFMEMIQNKMKEVKEAKEINRDQDRIYAS